SYHDDMFDYITSLSVIEHGVNIHKSFKEMSRLLKKGGYLLTSTDYWPEKVRYAGSIDSNENHDNVFCRPEIQEMIEIAGKCDLKLIEPMDYTYEKRLVSWKGLNYTFIFIAMRKE
ncbi:MAG TPA: methyltransferase domain-containing protein, partial [Nitrososphaeraceae archaeon]